MSTEELNHSFDGFASLMDLAAVDTSDLSAQMSRLQRAGIYVLDVNSAMFSEQPSNDPAEPANYNLAIRSKVLLFVPIDENDGGGDPSQMEGKDFNERYFIYGKQIKEAIQLLMGRYKSVGLPHKGKLGGVEGSEPGWVDSISGQRIVVRVRHYKSSDGQDRAGYDWLSPKAMAKAGVTWDVLGRDFLDEFGRVDDKMMEEISKLAA